MVDTRETRVQTIVGQVQEGKVSGPAGKTGPHQHDIVERLPDRDRALAMAVAMMMDIISDRAAQPMSSRVGSGMSQGIGASARSAIRQSAALISPLAHSRQRARSSQCDRAGTMGFFSFAT